MEEPKFLSSEAEIESYEEESVESEEWSDEDLQWAQDKSEELEEGQQVEEHEKGEGQVEAVKSKLFKKVEIKAGSEYEFPYDDDEEEEDEEEEISYVSSAISEISFIWEDEVFKFEELCDPGNIETVYKLKPTRTDFFDQSGVDQYTAVCKSLKIVPMTRLLQSLRTDEIDLSHRNVDCKNIRAMCAALEVNNLVSRLILKHNRLTPADCSFIGYVLLYNENISHLDLSGCRIGPEGVKALIQFLGNNLGLEELILSKCNIQDEGMRAFGIILIRNNAIKKLDLSYNNLAEESAEALGLALKMNTCITDLNLRYNNLFDPVAMRLFFTSLGNNPAVSRLDLSWNGLGGAEMGFNIAKFLKRNQSVQYLDLSDNRLEGQAILEIRRAIPKAKPLEVLKIGKNPISPEDLDSLLIAVKANPNIKMLDLEDLWVKKSFLKIASKITTERHFDVNFEGVLSNYEVHGPDYSAIILKRAQFEAQKPKKEKFKRDFGHLMWSLGDEPLTQNAFMDLVKKFKAKINKQLYPELMKQFTIPKNQLIDVVAMREKYLSLFPDSTPPPPKKKKPTKVETVKGKGKGRKKKHAEEGDTEDLTEGEMEEEDEYIEGFEEAAEIPATPLSVGLTVEEPKESEPVQEITGTGTDEREVEGEATDQEEERKGEE